MQWISSSKSQKMNLEASASTLKKWISKPALQLSKNESLKPQASKPFILFDKFCILVRPKLVHKETFILFDKLLRSRQTYSLFSKNPSFSLTSSCILVRPTACSQKYHSFSLTSICILVRLQLVLERTIHSLWQVSAFSPDINLFIKEHFILFDKFCILVRPKLVHKRTLHSPWQGKNLLLKSTLKWPIFLQVLKRDCILLKIQQDSKIKN